jgi:hypothetical protein
MIVVMCGQFFHCSMQEQWESAEVAATHRGEKF